MKLRDLKKWFASFPKEFDDYDVVYSEEELDDDYTYRKDFPINHGEVDENSKEVCLFYERLDTEKED